MLNNFAELTRVSGGAMPWGEDGGCLNIIRTGICNICKRTVLLQKLLLFFIRVIPICHVSVPFVCFVLCKYIFCITLFVVNDQVVHPYLGE